MAKGHELVFGPFRLDPIQRQLWRGEVPIELPPRPFAVLRYLAEHPGRVVSKEELLREVWAGTYVSTAALRVSIRAIRKALGKEETTPLYIETVGQDGYRFLGDSQDQTPESAREEASPDSPVIVGREAEIDQLHRWLRTALDGQRQCVFVAGESGIGKTAIVDLFQHQVRALGKVSIGHGQCVEQYGEGEAYLPVLEAMGRLCREAGGAQLVALVRRYAPTWLVQLPGLIDEAERASLHAQTQDTTQRRMLREMAELVEEATTRRPLLLVLEDLQWSDPSTLELLAYLARRRERARFLVIATYRPVDVLLSQHPVREMKQELQAHGQCQELCVELLTNEDIHAYLSNRFPNSSLSPALANTIHQRTNGNALFMVSVVEELVRQQAIVLEDDSWLFKGGLETIGTPESIRQLVERQVGRLSPEQQRVLEVASVVGAEFAVATVAAGLKAELDPVEEICEDLAWQSQFIEEIGVAEWPDGTLSGHYKFRHTLYQEVLYGQIGESRRVRLHRLIGGSLEAAYQTQAGELAAELALHFEQGRDYQRASQYLRQAAENASRRHAYQETIRHFRRALAVLPHLSDTPDRSQDELALHMALSAPLAAVNGWGNAEVEATYRQAQLLCEQQSDRRRSLPVLFGLWLVYHTRAELAAAHDIATQLLQLTQETQLTNFLMEAQHAMGNTLLRLGDLETARTHLEQSSQNYDPPGHQSLAFDNALDGGVAGYGYSAWVLWHLGYPDQAKRKIQEMFTLAEQRAQPLSLAWAYNAAAWVYQLCREPAAVLDAVEKGLAVDNDYGFAQLLAAGTIAQGWALVEQGQTEEGIAQLQQGLSAIRTTGTQIGSPWYLSLLAEALGKAGQIQDGLSLIDEAFAVIEKTGERLSEAECYRLRGELLLNDERKTRNAERRKKPKQMPSVHRSSFIVHHFEEAEVCYQQAIEIARQQNAKSFELRAATSLARLWQRQGKSQEAHTLLSDVYNWFTEGFETLDFQEAKAVLEA